MTAARPHTPQVAETQFSTQTHKRCFLLQIWALPAALTSVPKQQANKPSSAVGSPAPAAQQWANKSCFFRGMRTKKTKQTPPHRTTGMMKKFICRQDIPPEKRIRVHDTVQTGYDSCSLRTHLSLCQSPSRLQHDIAQADITSEIRKSKGDSRYIL